MLWVGRLIVLFQLVTAVLGWGKEGHYAVCKIAEDYLSEDALAAVKKLLPESAGGDLAAVCSWADEIRFHYHWSSALHFADTPDFKCNYGYCRDCHDSSGHKDRCVTGAILNYTAQLTSTNQDFVLELKSNLTEALMFLSHFIGDVHQPLHVGFLGDLGGNSIIVRWYRRKTNLHHNLLEPQAAHAVQQLLPYEVKGDLSAYCVWPDQVRHWYKYRWTSSLHFIDTPDKACTFDYSRDCVKDMCVAGAIQNFTSQLLHYREGSTDRRYNLTEALMFLSHFMGDIHQPMHVGFTSDEGGNTIELRWFRHKSNLHHVWDREIILTALKDYYENDMDLLQQAIEGNFTDGIWYDDVSSWKDCDNLLSCPTKYAAESISIACKWAYKGVNEGATLADEYFDSRMPIVMKRIAQGGVRLAMFLNQIFGDADEGLASPT
ncbi:hypothetical protein K2173_004428 [Erythroxylum novogranatense]|uniref:Aspergillus nuclease S1 n=1 Tax=Erythroxylum novogranatense TaxID=1862640 RepID=A0AAV8T4F9_9ROSI|nr:hypothetical protein K2173_004428 [Erythroxylum novogranatense]